MRSKNSRQRTPKEDAHLEDVKALPCSFCPAPPPSIAHHIDQDCHYTAVATCELHHVGAGGIHGGGWALPYSETVGLNITLRRLASDRDVSVHRQESTRTPETKIVPRPWAKDAA